MASRLKRKKAWREQQYKPGFVNKSKQKLCSIHDKPLRKEVGHE
jgi:hypothetical protein